MRQALRQGVVYSAFALTGVATATLGAALPAMLAEWRLTDRSGGALLLCAFAGSTLGALLAQRALRLLAVGGLALSALNMLMLSGRFGANGGFAVSALYPLFLAYGLGLGLTMTAISVLRSRETPVDQNHTEMNRLNLVWAAGACCAPVLALHSLRLLSVHLLLRSEAVAFGVAAVLLLLLSGAGALAVEPLKSPANTAEQPFAPLRMCLFAAAAVGLESAIGSWLTTYTERVGHAAGIAVSATSAFWLGLLLSRAVHSVRFGRWLQSRTGIGVHLLAVTLAGLLLVLASSANALSIAAFLSGFGLGPLYPLVLSLALPHYRSGWVFVAAGIGASTLPWFTGLVSTGSGSLRAGLGAPCATVLLLLLAAAWLWREIPVHTQTPA